MALASIFLENPFWTYVFRGNGPKSTNFSSQTCRKLFENSKRDFFFEVKNLSTHGRIPLFHFSAQNWEILLQIEIQIPIPFLVLGNPL